MRRLVTAAVVTVAAATLASGCTFGTPIVSRTDLQNDIASRLEKAGEKPQSVTCKEDLKGEIGQTTRCEVVLSDINAFEPIVHVTKVEMTPAMSQKQLEKSVEYLVNKQNDVKVDSVACESGLEGIKDKTARCTLNSDGEKLDAVVVVTKVDGLLMSFRVDQA
jgi:hypothetical protein